MRQVSLVIILNLISVLCWSQISGSVVDERGDALTYVNVYVEGSSIGTTTNFDGEYLLKLPEGKYTIVYQYIGYRSVEFKLDYKGKDIRKNIVLQEQSYEMPEITISANGEDPAYAIIRKAQEKRKFYKEQSSRYECDAYVRGFNKMYDAPEKIMGIEVGDLDGLLDSTRQGVIYLSESVSRLYVSGAKKKEVMFSSKLSGDDQGYSFNSAREMDFSVYETVIELNRKIVSPIANNAFNHYRFKLEGAHIDDNGQLVNKIKVIPKDKYGPSFFGYIYINEDLWNVNSLELGITKEASQLPFIDTLNITQNYIPVEPGRWMILSNVIQFRMGSFGFDVGGNFACVYSNYILDDIDEKVFNEEVYVVKSEANTREERYWDTIRPIPLSREEKLDYHRKDSIQIVRESPEYLDSIDREHNKFKFSDILTGYSYRNSQKQLFWNFGTPLTDFDVNTIQGWNGSVSLGYEKSFDKNETRRLESSVTLNYALSSEELRPEFRIAYRANRRNNLRFELRGGRALEQINRQNPISRRLNAIMTMFFRRNYMKAYDKKFVQFSYSQDLAPAFRLSSSIDYEDRSGLSNNYDGSFFYKDTRVFTDNIQSFPDHSSLIWRISLRIRPGEKIISYPDRKFKIGSDWPTIRIHYKKAFKDILGSDTDYDLLHASINKAYDVGRFGEFHFNIHGGYFINSPEHIIDSYHFYGNQTHIANESHYRFGFLMLPYYDLSTDEHFVQWQLEHNFKGSLLNKLPLLKKLNWHLVGGFRQLIKGGVDYREMNVGVDNLGYKLFRLFRIDGVWSEYFGLDDQASQWNFGIVVGLKFDI